MKGDDGMAWSKWYMTDDSCCQHMRKDGLNYEMIQLVWLDTTEEDLARGLHEYVVVKDEVHLQDEDTANKIIDAIDCYGYTVPFLIKEYGHGANDIIAECLLEDSILCDANIIGEFDTEKEAEQFIVDYINKEDAE